MYRVLFFLFLLIPEISTAAIWSWGSSAGDANQRVYNTQYTARVVCGAGGIGDPETCSVWSGSVSQCWGANLPRWGAGQTGNYTCTYAQATLLKSIVFPYIEPGAWYDKSSACTIEWRLVPYSGFVRLSVTQQAGNVVGMTLRGAGIYSKNSSNCRADILSLGNTWGYSTTAGGFSTEALRNNPYGSEFKYCLYIDNRAVDPTCLSSGPSTPMPEPDPVYCDVATPNTIDFGVVGIKDLASSTNTDTVTVSCSGPASVSMSFSGGNGSAQNGLRFPLGKALSGVICFADNGSCNKDGFKKMISYKSGTSINTIKTSILQSGNVEAGNYEASVVLIVQAY